MHRGLIAGLMLCASGAAAQHADTLHTSAPLFRWHDAWVASAVIGAASAVIPFDTRLSEGFVELDPHRGSVLYQASRVFDYLGDPGTIVIGLSTYVVGRIAGQNKLADAGLHTSEALILSGVETYLGKGLTGRDRPFVDPNDATRFHFGHGFGGGYRESMPSGHTSAAFAVAAALDAETAHWRPHRPVFVAPLMYLGAGLVGAARVYGERHWPSDVIVGALIGTSAGMKVVRYNHNHPRNRVDRWLGAIVFE
jgi:membrane-associated phospholipid phosphatase